MITSTTYALTGDVDDAATRDIKAHVYLIPGVGGISFEIVDGELATMIIKHKEDVRLDRASLEQAVSAAGDYHLA